MKESHMLIMLGLVSLASGRRLSTMPRWTAATEAARLTELQRDIGCGDDALVPTHYMVLGARNSGTNYLSRLVNATLQIPKVSIPGADASPVWKHEALSRDMSGQLEEWRRFTHDVERRARLGRGEAPPADSWPVVLIVQVTKNPFSWLLSMRRNPWHLRAEAGGAGEAKAAAAGVRCRILP